VHEDRLCRFIVLDNSGWRLALFTPVSNLRSEPLFATSLIEAGNAAGKDEINLANLAMMVEESVREIQARGGSRVGDKTLLDALVPAAESLRRSASE